MSAHPNQSIDVPTAMPSGPCSTEARVLCREWAKMAIPSPAAGANTLTRKRGLERASASPMPVKAV